jgi:hypothetical protein
MPAFVLCFVLLLGCGATPAAVEPVATPASNNANASYGTTRWVGRYECPQGVTGLTLEIVTAASGATATFRFYAVPENPGVPSGSFVMRGWVRSDGGVELVPDHWIEQPEHYLMVGLVGAIDPTGSTLRGRIREPECGALELTRA